MFGFDVELEKRRLFDYDANSNFFKELDLDRIEYLKSNVEEFKMTEKRKKPYASNNVFYADALYFLNRIPHSRMTKSEKVIFIILLIDPNFDIYYEKERLGIIEQASKLKYIKNEGQKEVFKEQIRLLLSIYKNNLKDKGVIFEKKLYDYESYLIKKINELENSNEEENIEEEAKSRTR